MKRRKFIQITGGTTVMLSLPIFGCTQKPRTLEEISPSLSLKDLAEMALSTAKSEGASYADIRICTYAYQRISSRDKIITGIRESESYGFGIRTMANGAWGFASSSDVTADEVVRISKLSTEIARASSTVRQEPIRLTPTEAYVDKYTSPYEIDPFAIPVEKKVEILLGANEKALGVTGIIRTTSYLDFEREEKYFASSEGSFIEQTVIRTDTSMTSVARTEGGVKSRSYQVPPLNIGWEHIENVDLVGNAERIAEEAVEHTKAPKASGDVKDLVMKPSHLTLTIHESVGHPTELDRALGWEADYAGTSFVTPDKLGNLKYGSEHVNITGDRTYPHGRGTIGYDDDGVKTRKFDIIRNGIFVGYQTTRATAPLLGQTESMGCCYADSWSSFPFLKIPNVSMEPGPSGSPTPDELIADTKDGILIDGRGSYSIDQQRYNFQFGGDAFWEIKNGKVTGMLKDVTYNSITTDFWNSCDAVAGEEFWEPHGVTRDGKGQPGQRGQMTHGCSWARFRNIQVGGGQV